MVKRQKPAEADYCVRVKFSAQIDVWNSLPSTVNFTSLMAFRRSLNNVDFGSHIHCRLE